MGGLLGERKGLTKLAPTSSAAQDLLGCCCAEHPGVHPHVCQLLEVGPRLKHFDGHAHVDQIDLPSEQLLAHVSDQLKDGRPLLLQQRPVVHRQASILVGVWVQQSLQNKTVAQSCRYPASAHMLYQCSILAGLGRPDSAAGEGG